MKIIMGICGIGNGHTFRQLPVFQHLLEQGHSIMIFGYGASLDYYRQNFSKSASVTLVEVANPYFVGKKEGLDFYASQVTPSNKRDFHAINCAAMQKANELFGKPDLVISDYECVSAQFAYAKGAPLITVDQQSKFLYGKFPRELNRTGYVDEVERLRMFFPLAKKRLAISFFSVEPSPDKNCEVEVFPPIIRDQILSLKNIPKSQKTSLLVYLTAQMPLGQSYEEMFKHFGSFPSVDFHVMLPEKIPLPENTSTVHFYHHGDKSYEMLLAQSHGVISTAGHTLLSEVLYLGKPLYAMPLPLYEQQINAKIIGDNGFGICQDSISAQSLTRFISNLKEYECAIAKDTTVLLKGSGLKNILHRVDECLGVNVKMKLDTVK